MVGHSWFIPASVITTMLLTGIAEWLHGRRVTRIRYLAFGPAGTSASWTRLVIPLRVLSVGAVCWGLLVLFHLSGSLWEVDNQREREQSIHHIVIGLDVSPSMQIVDAGAKRDQSRADRAREVLKSVLGRIDASRAHVSVIAFYHDARPVVVDTFDPDVVHNILNDLPLGQAFTPGKTNLYSVITSAEKLMQSWRAGSATLLIVSDGDTLPAEEIPTRSPALDRVLVLGVGDPFRGTFIHDHSSRQDRRSLSQFASQVRGEYLDVNQNHVPSDSLPSGPLQRDSDDALAWRQLALLAVAMGCSMLALLPVALVLGGGSWNPQRQPARELTREHFDDVWSIHS
jgi:Ca-activated chloride channel family protein